MGVALTVADSKRAFHQAFPHVIAPLYRRMVDELLVELHLLSRQAGFQAATLRSYAHDLGAAMGLLRDRLDKDLSLYAANLEKLAQAVELMEETLAAERRKRERQQAGVSETAAAGEPTTGVPAAG